MADHLIKERIQLEGDEKIAAQFAALGAAGKKLFDNLKQAQDSFQKSTGLVGFVNQVNKDIKALQKQVVTLGKAYGETALAAKNFATNVTLISGAVAGVGVAAFAFVKHAADVADQTDKAAQAAGLAIDQYGKLQFVFEQGNVDSAAFGTAMKKLNANIVQAADGVGQGAKLFRDLGVNVKDAAGNLLPTDVILQRIADRFQKLPDGPRKSALAVQLFGKAGAAIVPILNDGGRAMQELENRAVSLGLVLDKTAGKVGDAFGDAFNEVKRSVGGIATQVGLQFAPPLTEAMTALANIIAENRTQLLAFTQVLANQVGPAIKDIFNALAGKDADVVNKQFIQIRDTIASIGQAVGIVTGILNFAFAQLVDIVRPFVEIINEVFGTKFTAEGAIIAGIVLSLTGAFRLLGAGIKAVGLTWQLLVKLFGSSAGLVAAAIAGILGVIAEVQNTIDNLKVATAAWGEAFTGLPSVVAEVFGAIGEVITASLDAAITLFQKFQKEGLGAFQGLVDGVVGFFEDMGKSIQSVIDGIISGIQAAIAAAQKLLGLSNQSGGGGDSGSGGFRGGGLIRGRGTGTSDSIIARVSNGEYVMRAKAVRKYGLGLMSAINGMRFKPPTFALGGPVLAGGPALPALGKLPAAGPSGRPFDLHIGGEVFEGLLAPETVATKMVKFAQVKATRSAGRKPSWR